MTIKITVRIVSIATILSSAACLFAQDPPRGAVGAASLGMVYDSEIRGVRQLMGISGAASMTKPLDLDFEVKSTMVPPREDYILAVSAADSSVRLVVLSGGGVETRVLPGISPDPDRIEVSPTGASAVLYYSDTGKVQVMTGLPGRISLREYDILKLGSPLTALAVSDDGTIVLGAESGEDAAVVHFLSEDGVRQIATLREATSVTFAPRANIAYLVDSKQNTVFRWRKSTGELSPVATDADGISDPVSAAVSADSTRVFVANAGARTVTTLNLITGEHSSVECGCTPAGLDRLSGSSIFRITGVRDGVLWLFDGESRAPRIVFVATEQVAAFAEPSLSGRNAR